MLQCCRELGDGIGAMLRSPEDLGSEDQRWVELTGCSGKDFFYLFLFWAMKNQLLEKHFYRKGCE